MFGLLTLKPGIRIDESFKKSLSLWNIVVLHTIIIFIWQPLCCCFLPHVLKTKTVLSLSITADTDVYFLKTLSHVSQEAQFPVSTRVLYL